MQQKSVFRKVIKWQNALQYMCSRHGVLVTFAGRPQICVSLKRHRVWHRPKTKPRPFQISANSNPLIAPAFSPILIIVVLRNPSSSRLCVCLYVDSRLYVRLSMVLNSALGDNLHVLLFSPHICGWSDLCSRQFSYGALYGKSRWSELAPSVCHACYT